MGPHTDTDQHAISLSGPAFSEARGQCDNDPTPPPPALHHPHPAPPSRHVSVYHLCSLTLTALYPHRILTGTRRLPQNSRKQQQQLLQFSAHTHTPTPQLDGVLQACHWCGIGGEAAGLKRCLKLKYFHQFCSMSKVSTFLNQFQKYVFQNLLERW